MKALLICLLLSLQLQAQLVYYGTGTNTYTIYGLSSETKPASPPDNCLFVETNTGSIYRSSGAAWSLLSLNIATINKVTITAPATSATLTIPDGVTLNAGAGGTLGSNAFNSTAYLPNTSTAGVGSSPTASSTQTITHNLGRVPAIIRIYGYGSFTANAAATATTSSIGVFNSSGNFCVYQRYGAAITTTQAGLSSNTFAILLATGGGNFISGVIQNVTSSQFDVVWTETGTATAQVYLWEAQ